MVFSSRANTYPVIPLSYGSVLFPGKTLNISPADRQDVTAIIAKYYSGALQPKNKDNAPLIACVPLRSPYLSPDGKKLIDDSKRESSTHFESDASQATKLDLFDYGCLARISGIRGGGRGDVALVVDGVSRCKLEGIKNEEPYFEADIKEFKDNFDVWDPAVKGAFAHLKELSRELFQLIRVSSLMARAGSLSPLLIRQLEAFVARKDISDAGFLADFMAVLGQSSYEDKLWMLSATSVIHRLQRANELVQKQISTLQGSTKIITITNNSQNGIDMDKLRELQKRNQNGRGGIFGSNAGIPPGMGGLGQGDDDGNEVEELKKRLDESGLSDEAQKVATRELRRLQKMNPAQAEHSVIRNYLENLAEIPWSKSTQDRLDSATLARARKQLDDDHYGLEKIKKRLLEYLAVLRLKQSANSELEAQIKELSDKHALSTKEENEEKAPRLSDAETAKLERLKSKLMVDKSPILLLVVSVSVNIFLQVRLMVYI